MNMRFILAGFRAVVSTQIIIIDCKDPENPLVTKGKFDFIKENICVLVADAGGNHSDVPQDNTSSSMVHKIVIMQGRLSPSAAVK